MSRSHSICHHPFDFPILFDTSLLFSILKIYYPSSNSEDKTIPTNTIEEEPNYLEINNIIEEVISNELVETTKEIPKTKEIQNTKDSEKKNNDKNNNSNNKSLWRDVLLHMLKECRYLQVDNVSETNLKRRYNSILDVYFEIYLKELEYLIKRGFIKIR